MIDHYKTLQIPQTATKTEIKRSFRKLALRWHPDKNPKNQKEAASRFKEISDAYETLYDDESRRKYDTSTYVSLDAIIAKASQNRNRKEKHSGLFSSKDPSVFDDLRTKFANSDNFSDIISARRKNRQQANISHFRSEPFKSYLRSSYARLEENFSLFKNHPSQFRFASEYQFGKAPAPRKCKLCQCSRMQIWSDMYVYGGDQKDMISNTNALCQSLMCIAAFFVSCLFLYFAVLL